MDLDEQRDVLRMWQEFLSRRRPSPRLMREFYFEVVARSSHYRYGMAAEVFDLLINGVFHFNGDKSWGRWDDRHSDDHRAA